MLRVMNWATKGFGKRFSGSTAGLLCGLVWSGNAEGQAVLFPRPELANTSTGVIESFVAGDWYRGSGVVARDPRLIFSCAHVFFEGNRWATDYAFHRAYHRRREPGAGTAAWPRGLQYFTSYSAAVQQLGSESRRAFASDFTVLYGNRSFGPAVTWLTNAGPVLRSTRPKRIVGYPSEIDFTGANGFYLQHATPWFSRRAWRAFGSYHDFFGVSTGGGNSGGPVFVKNAATGEDVLAGILVSGSYNSAGIVALDPATDTLAGYALGETSKVRLFTDSNPATLPDGDGRFLVRSIPVSGFSGPITRLQLNLTITTSRTSDVEAYLRSPGGRTRWIIKKGSPNRGNLTIRLADYSETFRGQSANGTWKLWMRDTRPGFRATFNNASLRITAP